MFRPAHSAASLFLGLIGTAVLTGSALAQDPGFDEMPATSANWVTGPEVGEQIPDFAALDQNGVRRSFDEVKGPNGALVFFFRSADW